VTIILGGDSPNKTFSPKRTWCQKSVLFPQDENYFVGRRDVGCDKFEMYYVFENHIVYPFTKYACPITFKNKPPVWELVKGTPIKSEEPQNPS
jgi:hypothetical protein